MSWFSRNWKSPLGMLALSPKPNARPRIEITREPLRAKPQRDLGSRDRPSCSSSTPSFLSKRVVEDEHDSGVNINYQSYSRSGGCPIPKEATQFVRFIKMVTPFLLTIAWLK